MLDQFRAMADARHPVQARLTAHQSEVLAWADTEIDRLRAECASCKTVAEANGAAAQSHVKRWASAEALLQMALLRVETEGDDSLAHEIRRHLSAYDIMEQSNG